MANPRQALGSRGPGSTRLPSSMTPMASVGVISSACRNGSGSGHLVSVIADAAYDTVALGLPDPARTHRNVETNVHDALARLDRLLRTEARPCPSAPPASAIHSPAASLSVHEQASIVGR